MLSVWWIVAILAVVVLLIWLYGILIKRYQRPDYLKCETLPCSGCDYWGFSHLILYGILGFLFPAWIIPLFLIGIVWEMLEQLTGQPEVREQLFGSFRADKYWYGRLSDVIFNGFGLIIGSSLRLAISA